MARPPGRVRWLWIDVPGEVAGLDLIDRLSRLHAELSPRPDGCCRVGVELHENEWDADVTRVFRVVPTWAGAFGLARTRVELGGHVVVVDSVAG